MARTRRPRTTPTPDERRLILTQILGQILDSQQPNQYDLARISGPPKPRPVAPKDDGGGGGGGFWGNALGTALDVLDTPRAAVFSAAKELSDLTGGSMEGESASFSDFWNQTVDDDKRIYGSDVLAGNPEKGIKGVSWAKGLEIGEDDSGWLKVAKMLPGLGLDIAADPLTYVFGAGVFDDAFRGATTVSKTGKLAKEAGEAARASGRSEAAVRALEGISGDVLDPRVLEAIESVGTAGGTKAAKAASDAVLAERADITSRALKYGRGGLTNAEILAEYGQKAGLRGIVPGTGRLARKLTRAEGPTTVRLTGRSEKLAEALAKTRAGITDTLYKSPLGKAFGGADYDLKASLRGLKGANHSPYEAAQILKYKRSMKVLAKAGTERYLREWDEATAGLDDALLSKALRGDEAAQAALGERFEPVRGIYNKLWSEARNAGVNIRNLDDYAPNILTPQAREILAGSKQFKGQNASGIGKAFFEKARTLKPDENGIIRFLDEEAQIGVDATPQQIVEFADNALRKFAIEHPQIAGELDVMSMSLFSGSAREQFGRYANGLMNVVHRNNALEKLADAGIGVNGIRQAAELSPELAAEAADLRRLIVTAERELGNATDPREVQALTETVAQYEDQLAEIMAQGTDGTELFSLAKNLTREQTTQVAKFAADEIRQHLSVEVRNGTMTPRDAALALMQTEKMFENGGLFKFVNRIVGWLKSYQIATPGFVNRNLLGGAFANGLYGIEGVPARSYKEYLRLVHGIGPGETTPPMFKLFGGQYRKAKLLSAEDVKLRDDILSVIGRGQVGSEFSHVQEWIKNEPTYSAKSLLPTRKNFLPVAARKANERAEALLRGSLAHAVLTSKGGANTVDDAIEWVAKLHFDYDDLSRVERRLTQTGIPFYTWTRKNFPLQLEMMVKNPKQYARYEHFTNAMEGIAPETGLYEPEYFGREGYLQTPFETDGNPVYLAPDLPFRDVNRVTEYLTGDMGENPLGALSMVSPLFKGPVEYWAGKQLFKNLPLKDKPVALPKGIQDTVGPVMGRLGKAEKSNGRWYVTERNYYALGQAFPPIATFGRLFPNDPEKQEKMVTSWLSWGGLGTRTLTENDSEAAKYFEQEYDPRTLKEALDKAGL